MVLLAPRTDIQLAALLEAEGARTYTVYSFELGTSLDRSSLRHWIGLLLMPRTSDLGSLTDITVEVPGFPALADRLYRDSDGTWSKILLNRFGEAVGVASAYAGTVRVMLDLDADGVVDVLHALGLDGREVVIVMDNEGAVFLQHQLLGGSYLCDPRTTRDRSDRPSLLGQAGTFLLCDDGSGQRGPLAGVARAQPTTPVDPIDRACEGRTGLALGGPGLAGPRMAPRGGAAAAAAAGGASDRAFEDDYRKREALIYSLMEWLMGVEGVESVTIESDEEEAPEGARDRPGIDTDTGAEALDQVCEMRARSARRWAVTIEALEEQSAGATDTDCEDPVTDPAAAASEKVMPKCGESRDRESVTEQMMDMLGAYQDRQCGPTEQPGPDGQCSGGRTLPDGTARLWYGYGDLIGLVPCEGVACDPAENP